MKKMIEQDGKSLDMVNENLKALKAIFPEAFTEDGVDFEVLRQLLGDAVDVGEEKYGLTWHGKKKARQIALMPSMGTLRPCPEESVDWDTTQNLFIEGDNLEVLKLLQKSYANKGKMIYIDPPYNTGKEFIYPDKFQDNLDTYLKYSGQKDDEGFKISSNTESSGRYHTNWLSMMYPRLKLSRNLLRDDGVIFISIDENELTHLKAICDEIFGEENFIECIAWNKRIPKNDKGIGNIHEYILVYARSFENVEEFTMRKDGLEEVYELTAKLKRDGVPLEEAEKEVKKLYKKNGYDRGITLYNSLDEKYRLWGKINMSWPNANTFGPRYKVLHPELCVPVKIPDRGWRWKEDTFNEAAVLVEGKYQSIKKLYDGSCICGRIWFATNATTQPSSITYLDAVNTFLLRSVLSLKSDGGVEVENLFEGKSYYSYPKPTSLIRILFSAHGSKDGNIFLDFFAGSCTTAHAVMALNAEDSVSRRCISVQLPEPSPENSEAFRAGYKVISEVGKERIRCAAAKIKEENPEYEGDLGFKVFKLDSSNIRAWNPDRNDLEQTLIDHMEHLVEGRSEEDVLYELLLKRGVDLTVPIVEKTITGKTVYSIGYGVLFACLDTAISREEVEDLAQGIIDWHKELEPAGDTQVVFRDSAFANDIAKTNMTAILEQNGIKHVRSL
ncbi:MAG: site-specific DNA-methyltransferase [Deltaproteobacteria bacterium]|nr:site-specific DNA-methyltransferase [Deltaproteobacteria bacterium]